VLVSFDLQTKEITLTKLHGAALYFTNTFRLPPR